MYKSEMFYMLIMKLLASAALEKQTVKNTVMMTTEILVYVWIPKSNPMLFVFELIFEKKYAKS